MGQYESKQVSDDGAVVGPYLNLNKHTGPVNALKLIPAPISAAAKKAPPSAESLAASINPHQEQRMYESQVIAFDERLPSRNASQHSLAGARTLLDHQGPVFSPTSLSLESTNSADSNDSSKMSRPSRTVKAAKAARSLQSTGATCKMGATDLSQHTPQSPDQSPIFFEPFIQTECGDYALNVIIASSGQENIIECIRKKSLTNLQDCGNLVHASKDPKAALDEANSVRKYSVRNVQILMDIIKDNASDLCQDADKYASLDSQGGAASKRSDRMAAAGSRRSEAILPAKRTLQRNRSVLMSSTGKRISWANSTNINMSSPVSQASLHYESSNFSSDTEVEDGHPDFSQDNQGSVLIQALSSNPIQTHVKPITLDGEQLVIDIILRLTTQEEHGHALFIFPSESAHAAIRVSPDAPIHMIFEMYPRLHAIAAIPCNLLSADSSGLSTLYHSTHNKHNLSVSPHSFKYVFSPHLLLELQRRLLELNNTRLVQAQQQVGSYMQQNDTLLSGSSDGTVCFWDLNTGYSLYSLDAQAGGVADVLLFGDMKGGHIPPFMLTYSHSRKDTCIRIWSMRTLSLVAELSGGHMDPAWITTLDTSFLKFSPNSLDYYSSSLQKKLSAEDQSLHHQQQHQQHYQGTNLMMQGFKDSFSSAGESAHSGLGGSSGSLMGSSESPSSGIRSASVSRSNSSGKFGTPSNISKTSKASCLTIKDLNLGNLTLAFSGDSEGNLVAWDFYSFFADKVMASLGVASSGAKDTKTFLSIRPKWTVKVTSSHVTHITPDEDVVVVGYADGHVAVLDALTGRIKFSKPLHKKSVYKIQLLSRTYLPVARASHSTFFSLGDDQRFTLWNEKLSTKKTYSLPFAAKKAVKIENYLYLFGSSDSFTKIDLKTGKFSTPIHIHTSDITGFYFVPKHYIASFMLLPASTTPQGTLLLQDSSSSTQGFRRLSGTQSNAIPMKLTSLFTANRNRKASRASLTSLSAFYSDAKIPELSDSRLLDTDMKYFINIEALMRKKFAEKITDKQADICEILPVKYYFALTISKDNTAKLWDMAKKKPLARLLGHQGPINLAVHYYDNIVITASMDNSIKIWKL